MICCQGTTSCKAEQWARKVPPRAPSIDCRDAPAELEQPSFKPFQDDATVNKEFLRETKL